MLKLADRSNVHSMCISALDQKGASRMMSKASHHNERCIMKSVKRGMGIVCASLMICGLLAVPKPAWATDGSSSSQHRLLSAELKAKIERLKDKLRDQREDHHNPSGLSGSVEALQTEVASLKTDLAGMASNQSALLGQISALLARVDTLERNGGGGGSAPPLTELAKYITVDSNPINGVKGPHVIFTGVNLHVRSGSGSTGDNGTPTGLGNLIIGYNEGPHPDPTSGRNGSHNIVGGTLNAFTSTAGLVMGYQNWVQGEYATILGGRGNLAQGRASAILGGQVNFTGSENQTVP